MKGKSLKKRRTRVEEVKDRIGLSSKTLVLLVKSERRERSEIKNIHSSIRSKVHSL